MTQPVTPTSTLAELVIDVPARAAVFDHAGIDYCCEGARTLERACAEADVDLTDLTARLAQIETTVEPPPSGITALVGHLLDTHHRYLHDALPRLDDLATNVLRVHGDRHPDLVALHQAVFELHADLEPHLMKEELILFPACLEIDAASGPVDLPFGSVSNPVRVLMREHDTTGALLADVQIHLDDHPLPEDACASYTALYATLRELIDDTHQHVFKENHLLFPAVIERWTDLNAATDPSMSTV